MALVDGTRIAVQGGDACPSLRLRRKVHFSFLHLSASNTRFVHSLEFDDDVNVSPQPHSFDVFEYRQVRREDDQEPASGCEINNVLCLEAGSPSGWRRCTCLCGGGGGGARGHWHGGRAQAEASDADAAMDVEAAEVVVHEAVAATAGELVTDVRI